MKANKLSLGETIALIHRIEDEYPVSEWTINGLHVWPFVRLGIGVQLRNQYYGAAVAKPRPSAEHRRSHEKELRRDRRSNARLLRAGDAALFSSASGKTKIAGRYYSQYMDPFASFLRDAGFKATVIERDKHGDGGLPRYAPSVWLSYPRLKPILGGRAALLFLRKFRIALPCLDEVRTLIGPYLADESQLTRRKILSRYLKIFALKRFYSLLLRMARPRIAIVQCFYAYDSMAIAWACKGLGIPCFDYQHGVQGQLHYAYSDWRRMPRQGYELFVDGFLTWDEASAAQLRGWLAGRLAVFTVGNLWHEIALDFKADFKEAFEKLETERKGRPLVLFTAQDYMPEPWVLEAMRKTTGHFWCIRLHPQHQELAPRFLAALGDAPNYDIVLSSSLPLPLLLALSSLHVTANSSVVKEAEHFGVKSVVTDAVGLAYYRDLIEAGAVMQASNAAELSALCCQDRDPDDSASRDSSFPERGAFLRYIGELQDRDAEIRTRREKA